MIDKLLTFLETKAKSLAAGLGTAATAYAVGAIEDGKPLSLPGLIGALASAPIVARWVHQVENAGAPAKPARR